MTLQTLYVCNSGNTASAVETRELKSLRVIVGDSHFEVTDFTLDTQDHIVLLTKQI
jgi:hypothetical protein